MRNPLKNAVNALLHNPRHLVFAIFRRMPWLIPDDERYIKLYWKLTMDYPLNLETPRTFNEKLQWLKLHNRKEEYATLVDKYAVKEYVAKQIGEEYVIPTIGRWDKPSDIEWDKLPNQFVLKTNHDGGGNGIVVCKDKSKLNKRKALRELRHSFYRNVYMIGREWPYKKVKKCVFAEQYMEDSQLGELRDYKFYCFNGVPKVMLIALGRANGTTKMNYYDMDFNQLDFHQGYPHTDFPIEKPRCFDEMKQIVTKLSQDIPTVRMDLYEVNGQIYFGEFTFFDSGGTGSFYPTEWDKIFGDWIELPNDLNI